MKTVKGIVCYEEVDLTCNGNLVRAIMEAKQVWSKACAEFIRLRGDVGSCVLGAGISIDYIPKGKRSPRRLMVISQYDVARAQGSVVWEDSKDLALEVFKEHGIATHYSWGSMD